jgi:hypothetical protein
MPILETTELSMLYYGLEFANFKPKRFLEELLQAEADSIVLDVEDAEPDESESSGEEQDKSLHLAEDELDELEAEAAENPGPFFNTYLSSIKRLKLPLRRFKACYGSAPVVLVKIWEELQTDGHVIDATRRDLEDFLMTMYFLKNYPSEHCMAGIFGLHEETIRQRVWNLTRNIQSLKVLKIVWEDLANIDVDLPLTVDGVHCRTKEQWHETLAYDTKYFSHKFKAAGVSYEVALLVHEDRVVWLNGPFKAGTNDLAIFTGNNGLHSFIPAGKKVIADKGYCSKDFEHILSTPSSYDVKAVSEFKGRARARQETFNARLKNFGILDQRFRQELTKHVSAFEAVAVICQYQMEYGSPLMDV